MTSALLTLLPVFLLVLGTSPLAAIGLPQTSCKPNAYCQTTDYRRPYLTIDYQNKSDKDYTIVFTATLRPDTAKEEQFTAKRFVRAGQTVQWLRHEMQDLSDFELITTRHSVEGPEPDLPPEKINRLMEIAGPDGLIQKTICHEEYYCLYSVKTRAKRIYIADKFRNVPLVLIHTVRMNDIVLLENISALPGLPDITELFVVPSEAFNNNRTLSLTGEMQFGYINRRTDKDHVYRLPYQSGESFRVSQGYGDKITHVKPESYYALDWSMPIGTPILAVRDGIVVDVEDKESRSGLIPALLKSANVVRILHQDGTIATYAHLVKDGARVEEGRRVKAGDIVGFSGNTGYSSGPHLHFAVAERNDPKEPLTAIPTLFNLGAGHIGHVESGKSHRAP